MHVFRKNIHVLLYFLKILRTSYVSSFTDKNTQNLVALTSGQTLKPGLAWSLWPVLAQNWSGLKFGLKFGLAPNFGPLSNFGKAQNLASSKFLGLRLK